MGNETQLLLNENGQVGQLTDANGRLIDFGYDNQGNLTEILAPNNNATFFGYDDRGNLTSQIDAEGNLTQFTYEPTFNQLTGFTDPLGNGIDYSYDESGNLTAIEYEDGSSETFEYNDNGDVTVSANRRGQEILYSYNEQSQLVSQINPDAEVPIEYTYDARGNLDTVTDGNGTIDLDYDQSDRLTKITYPGDRFLEYTYDAGGRRTSMIDQDGKQVNYGYDAAGRLASLTDGNGDAIVSYEYDEVGRLAREDKGNGTYTTYSYDLAGQLLSIENYAPDDTVNSSSVYTYDDLGRQTSLTTLDGEWSYEYDAIGQLTGADFVSTNPDLSDRSLTYEYDAAGNRINTIENGESTGYTTNNLNQYTDVNGFEYQYDDDGNLVSKTTDEGTFLYGYNSENQLISVTSPDDTLTTYEYDPFGNRIASIVDGERTEYLIDPFGFGDVVGEYDGDGNLIASYTHGIGLETITNPDASYYYDFNATGSTVGLTNGEGGIVNSYFYDPFGTDINETEAVANPYEFVGQYGVAEEANGLDFMRARFYDSGSGRFVSPDPIGLNGNDTNLYRYVVNNPINGIDPIGLKTYSIGAGVSASGLGFGATVGIQFAWDDNSKWWNPNVSYTSGVGASTGLGVTGKFTESRTSAKNIQELTGRGSELGLSLPIGPLVQEYSKITNAKGEVIGESRSSGLTVGSKLLIPEVSSYITNTIDLGTPVDDTRDFILETYGDLRDIFGRNRNAELFKDAVDSTDQFTFDDNTETPLNSERSLPIFPDTDNFGF